MALALESLVFNVESQKLLDAKTAIDNLAKSMGNLNKVSAEDAKAAINAAKAREADAKAATAAARAREVEAKAALAAAKITETNTKLRLAEEAATRKVTEQIEKKSQAQEKASQKQAAEAEKAAQREAAAQKKIVEQLERKAIAEEKARVAAEKSAVAEAKKITVLERQKSILDFMSQGFSKGQSSVLAYAKASGSLTDELKELEGVLQTQRKLMGSDPFDKSMSGLIALKNQYGEIREAIRQYNADMDLTRNQTRELTRDKERIIEKMKLEGKSFSDIKNAIREHNAAYTEQAAKVNSLMRVEKERERSARDTTNATRALAKAEENAASIMQSLGGITAGAAAANKDAAISIANYERNLRLAGITGETAAKKLALFRTQQNAIAAESEKRQSAYLTRALLPQFSDIFVGLTTGMNPMTVMLQQLPQINDLITLTGRNAKDTVGILTTAAREMITRLQGTAASVGIAIGQAFIGLGKNITNGLIAPLGLAVNTFRAAKDFFTQGDIIPVDFGPNIDKKTLAVNNLKVAWSSFTAQTSATLKILTSMAAVFGGAVLVSIIQTANAMDRMNESLQLYGARLGLSRDDAVVLSNSLATLGASANDVKGFFGELAKAGFTVRSQLEEVTAVAVKLSSTTSLSLADIAKMYGDLSKDPVKALEKLALETGRVEAAEIKRVDTLVKTGQNTKAVEEATKLMNKAFDETASAISKDITPINALLKEMKTWIAGISTEFSKLATSGVLGKIITGLAAAFTNARIELQKLIALSSYERGMTSFGVLGDTDAGKLNARLAALNAEQKASNDGYRAMIAGNASVQSAMQTTQQFTAEGVINQKRYNETVKEFAKDNEKLEAKSMSKQSYVAKKIQETQALAGSVLMLKDFSAAKAKFEKEWEDATKVAKTPKTDAQKELAKQENYYAKTLERVKDLTIKATGAQNDYTDAHKMFLDIKDDPRYTKMSKQEREVIDILLQDAHIRQIRNDTLKEEEKILERLDKVWDDYNKTVLRNQSRIEEGTAELEFQYSVLGKTESTVRELTNLHEERKNIAKIITDYALKELDILQKYAQAANGLTGDALEREAENLVNKLGELTVQKDQEIGLARQNTNLKVVQHYQQVWNEIQSGLSDALYTSLTEGGKTGAVKVKDLIKAQLKKLAMEPINLVVNLVMDTGKALLGAALNYVSGGSGSAGGLGSTMGLVSNARSAYNMYSGATLGAINQAAIYSGATYGTGFATQQSAMLAAQEAGLGLGGSAGTLGTVAQGLGWVAMPFIVDALVSKYGGGKTMQTGVSLGGSFGTSGWSGGIGENEKTTSGWFHDGRNAAYYSDTDISVKDMLSMLSGNAAYSDKDGRSTYSSTLDSAAYAELLTKVGVKIGEKTIQAEKQILRQAGDSLDIYETQLVDIIVPAFKTAAEMSEDEIRANWSNLIDTTSFRYIASSQDNQYLEGYSPQVERFVGDDARLQPFAEELADTFSTMFGIFKSTRRLISKDIGVYSAIDNALNDLYTQTVTSFKNLGEQLGATDIEGIIDNYVADIKVENVGSIQELLSGAATQLQEGIGRAIFPVVDEIRSVTGEAGTWVETFSRVASEASVVSKAFDKLGLTLSTSNVADELLRASDTLVRAFGGIEGLNNKLASYYENYYTAEEKRINVIKDIATALQQAGAQITESQLGSATRVEFRAVFESIVETAGAAHPLAIAMLQVESAFAGITTETESLTDSATAAAEATKKLNDEVNSQRLALERELMQLLGDTNGLRNLEIESIHESNRALKERIWSIEDSRKAASDAFAALQRAINAEKKLLSDKYSAEVDAINNSVNAQKEANRLQEQSANEMVNSVRKILDALTSALEKNLVDSFQMNFARQQAARSVIRNAASSNNIFATGLEDALSTVDSNEKKYYSTFEDYARDQLLTGNDIAKLKANAEGQLSTAELTLLAIKNSSELADGNAKAQLDSLKKQYDSDVAALDQTLASAQLQLDALNGINNSVISVKDALAGFQAAISGAISSVQNQNRVSDSLPTTSSVTNQGQGSAGSFTESSAWYGGNSGLDYSTLTGIFGSGNVPNTAVGHAYGGALSAEQWSQVAASANPREVYQQLFNDIVGATTSPWTSSGEKGVGIVDSTGGLIQVIVGNTQQEINSGLDYYGMDGADIRSSVNSAYTTMGADAGMAIYNAAVANGLPAFAKGGMHSGGLRLVGENGPELEVTGPSRIWSASQTSAMLSGSSDDDLKEKIIEVLSMIQAETRASAINTARTAKLLDRSTDEQDSIKVTIVSDLTV